MAKALQKGAISNIWKNKESGKKERFAFNGKSRYDESHPYYLFTMHNVITNSYLRERNHGEKTC